MKVCQSASAQCFERMSMWFQEGPDNIPIGWEIKAIIEQSSRVSQIWVWFHNITPFINKVAMWIKCEKSVCRSFAEVLGVFLAILTLQVGDFSEVTQQTGGRARTRTCDSDIRTMEPSHCPHLFTALRFQHLWLLLGFCLVGKHALASIARPLTRYWRHKDKT